MRSSSGEVSETAEGSRRRLRPGGVDGHPGVASLLGRGPGGIAARGRTIRRCGDLRTVERVFSLAVHRIGGTIRRPSDFMLGSRMQERVRRWRGAGPCTHVRRSCSRSSRATPAPAARPADRRGTPRPRLLPPRLPLAFLLAAGPRGRAARRPVGAPPPGLRRRGHDRAGTFLIAAVAALLLAAGLVHHPVVQARARAFDLGGGGRAFVLDRAPTGLPRPNVGGWSTWTQGTHLTEPCVPGGRRRAGRTACSWTPGTPPSSSATPTRVRTRCSRGPEPGPQARDVPFAPNLQRERDRLFRDRLDPAVRRRRARQDPAVAGDREKFIVARDDLAVAHHRLGLHLAHREDRDRPGRSRR